MKKIIFFLIFSFLILSFRGKGVNAANQARLFLVPSSGNFNIGETLSVTVKVDTAGENINQVKINLNYPSALLDFVSVDKNNSFVTNWLIENTDTPGLITYVGGLPTPGKSGSDLTFLTLNFLVKSEGVANLIFTSGSAVYLDQPGTAQTTNILNLNISTGGTYNFLPLNNESPTPTLPASGNLPETAGWEKTIILSALGFLLIFSGFKLSLDKRKKNL